MFRVIKCRAPASVGFVPADANIDRLPLHRLSTGLSRCVGSNRLCHSSYTNVAISFVSDLWPKLSKSQVSQVF